MPPGKASARRAALLAPYSAAWGKNPNMDRLRVAGQMNYEELGALLGSRSSLRLARKTRLERTQEGIGVRHYNKLIWEKLPDDRQRLDLEGYNWSRSSRERVNLLVGGGYRGGVFSNFNRTYPGLQIVIPSRGNEKWTNLPFFSGMVLPKREEAPAVAYDCKKRGIARDVWPLHELLGMLPTWAWDLQDSPRFVHEKVKDCGHFKGVTDEASFWRAAGKVMKSKLPQLLEHLAACGPFEGRRVREMLRLFAWGPGRGEEELALARLAMITRPEIKLEFHRKEKRKVWSFLYHGLKKHYPDGLVGRGE